MTKLFGTDGVRGIVNNDLTIDLATKIGAGVARILSSSKKRKLTFLIGSDTRLSKDMLTCAVAAGVLSEGCNIIDVGVLPTPAISYLITYYKLDGGFVVSASHNPSEYNGIKVLDENGFKLQESLENQVEDIILNDFKYNVKVNDNGTYTFKEEALNDYIEHLLSTINNDIKNIKILVDTAHGAASLTAKNLFDRLNANYTIMNNEPNGLNINDNAGSTHIKNLQEEVVKGKYDIGIAFDGDADRCILVDETGQEIDGDYIIAIAGNELLQNNKLTNNTLVGTIMTNLGFIKFCEKNNINFVATSVGDKYVLEEMLKNNYILGGEQSGHIIFKEFANTGDGELTALQILSIMSKNKKKLSELAAIMDKYPQVLKNVTVSKKGKEEYKSNTLIQKSIEEMTQKLNGEGRIVVRPSGTENLIRVMLEGKDLDLIEKICDDLVDIISKELN